MLYAQLEAIDCTAELWLNDVPLSRIADDPERMKLENVAIDHWVLEGDNTLELVVSPGATPSVARAPHDDRRLKPTARASACILRVSLDTEGTSRCGDVLTELNFLATTSELDAAPWVASSGVRLERPRGQDERPWSFETAEALTLGDDLLADAERALREIEECYETGDPARLYRVLEHTLGDVQRAFPAQTETHLLESYAELMTRYTPSRPPVLREPRHRDYRIVGHGRLLECVDRDWTASVLLHDEARGLAVPLQLWLGRPSKGGPLRVLR